MATRPPALACTLGNLAACFLPELAVLAAAVVAFGLRIVGLSAAFVLFAAGCWFSGPGEADPHQAGAATPPPASAPPKCPPEPQPKVHIAGRSHAGRTGPAQPVAAPRHAAGLCRTEPITRLQARLPLATSESSRAATAARFLVGRNNHEAHAGAAIDAYVRWRAALGPEPTHSPETEAAIAHVYSPRLLRMRDRRGRPVVVVRLGDVDVSVAESRNVTVAMLLRRHISTLDRISAAIEASADPLAGHLLVQDLHGTTVAKFVRSRCFFQQMLRLDQAYYPELLGQLRCVRAPRLAAWAFEQVKSWIDPSSAAKVQLSRGGPAEALADVCSPELIEQILEVLQGREEVTLVASDDAENVCFGGAGS